MPHLPPHRYTNGDGRGLAIAGLLCGVVWAWLMAEVLLRI